MPKPNSNPLLGLAILISTTAWACSVSSTAYCRFVNRSVIPAANATLPEGAEGDVLRLAMETHGVGFWAWQLGNTCLYYCNAFGACPSFDTKFNAARAFTAVTNILGGVGMFSLLFHLCMPVNPTVLKTCSLFFLLSTLFEGLTLLIMRSSICTDPGFFDYLMYFWPDDIASIEIESVSCSLSRGSNLAIGATVCWFLAALVCGRIPPERRGDDE